MKTVKVGTILLVEDNPNDIELVRAALSEYHLDNEVAVARDGAEALDYLHHQGKFQNRDSANPVVILLDLKMPKLNGLEVLRVIKSDALLKNIPVVMLTSSQEEPDLATSYQLGANAYVVKPVEFEEFVKAVKQINAFWVLTNEPPPGSKTTQKSVA